MNACDQAIYYGIGLSESSVGYPWISHRIWHQADGLISA